MTERIADSFKVQADRDEAEAAALLHVLERNQILSVAEKIVKMRALVDDFNDLATTLANYGVVVRIAPRRDLYNPAIDLANNDPDKLEILLVLPAKKG